jgi:hypothetical protein
MTCVFCSYDLTDKDMPYADKEGFYHPTCYEIIEFMKKRPELVRSYLDKLTNRE